TVCVKARLMTNISSKVESFISGFSSRFLRLNIGNKMLVGYFPLSIILVLISVFTLSGLERLNVINGSILAEDIPVMRMADNLTDDLLGQELYGRRYVILGSHDMLRLFWNRAEEFDRTVKEIKTIAGDKDIDIDNISVLHGEYNALFVERFNISGAFSGSRAVRQDSLVTEKREQLLTLIGKLTDDAIDAHKIKTARASSIGVNAFRIAVVLCVLGIVVGIGAALLITKNIAYSIRELNSAVRKISEGEFDDIHVIRNEDELGELSEAFVEMAKKLKRLEEMYLDASPLTRLPGGIAIENVLKKRLSDGRSIAFCLIDIDNFKAYNDHYGYARGSDLIVALASIIEKTAAERGGDDVFTGHIGGDDFVMILSVDRYAEACSLVIARFDAAVRSFYAAVDLESGYIAGQTRQGKTVNFPVATLSIAVVTNSERAFSSHVEVGAVAAELKEYAKSIPKSVYVVDHRGRNYTGVSGEGAARG
ncbi:MAG: diguanylate cyclase, partial [Thermodesulfobacteriota bacterium]